jgi:DNA (cytosine-5)-methyltransferase 1
MSIRVGSDFSGVGAFEQSLMRLGIKHKTVFACDKDKYARLTYIHNYGEPDYYPSDVYEREIPGDSLDIYMTSPPCQSFSLAGKRLGKDDKRGILFFNSHEFIVKNKPRYFIFENVKGLLSDDGGKTFSEWLHLLGGKSVNGMPIVFPYDGAVPYHVYWKVLNAKDFGVPQNRERVFIIGIRDDADNVFSFPKEIPLTKRLKDVLESEVDEKYYLSDKMLEYFNNCADNFNAGKINFKDEEGVAGAITSSSSSLDISDNILKLNQDYDIVGDLEKGGERGLVFSENSKLMNCLTATDYKQPKQIEVQAIPQLTQVGSLYENNSDAGRIYDDNGIACTIKSEGGGLGAKTGLYEVEDIVVHNMMPRSSTTGKGGTGHLSWTDGITYCLDTGDTNAVESSKRIRKLTPRECFRLMDFPDTFDFSVVSNSQAYKQAGNSIVVNVLAQIISKLKL